MSKFKPTAITTEFINAAADAAKSGKEISMTTAIASQATVTDDQIKTIDYSSSQSISKDITTPVSNYYRKDGTSTLVLEVAFTNKTLAKDVKINTILLFGTYEGKNILVGVSRLNNAELIPAFDGSIVTLEYDLFITFKNADTVQVLANDAGLATNQSLHEVDNSAVHKNGNETIYDKKKFIEPIDGTADITVHNLWDGVDLTTLRTPGIYSGYNVKPAGYSNAINFCLLVEVSDGRYSVKQTMSDFNAKKTSVRYFNSNSWSSWGQSVTDSDSSIKWQGDHTFQKVASFVNGLISLDKIVVKPQGDDVIRVKPNGGNVETSVLQVITGNDSGSAVGLGAGGLTVLGGGESAQNLLGSIKSGTFKKVNTSMDSEQTFVASDDSVFFLTGYQYSGNTGAIWRVDSNGAMSIWTGSSWKTVINADGSLNDNYLRGNLVLSNDNSMVRVGNDGDIALVKKQGQDGTLVVGNGKTFRLQKSNNTSINTSDTLTDLLVVNPNGKVSSSGGFYGNLQGNADTATRTSMIDISNNTNLDDLRDNGNYSLAINNVYNSPVDHWFTLVVVKNGGFNGTQTLTDTNNGNVWIRTWNSSNQFTNWEKMSKDNTVVHNSGDQYIDGRVNAKSFGGNADTATNLQIQYLTKGFHVDGMRKSGTYTQVDGDINGLPAYPVWGIMEVINNGIDIIQKFNVTNGTDDFEFCQRHFSVGKWTDWKKF